MRQRLRSAARTAVLTVNHPLAKRRSRQAIESAERPIKLELGGLEPRPGWLVTNVNAVTRHYLDATKPWPFEDGALELVYADNVIEHVPLAAGRRLLAEAHRCLRPGGVLRLVTPDLGKHVQLYLDGTAAVDGPVGAFYRSLGLTVDHPSDVVRIPCAEFGHHVGYLYDAAGLTAELVGVGFEKVAEHPLGASPHPPLDGLDQRSDEGSVQMALEAIR